MHESPRNTTAVLFGWVGAFAYDLEAKPPTWCASRVFSRCPGCNKDILCQERYQHGRAQPPVQEGWNRLASGRLYWEFRKDSSVGWTLGFLGPRAVKNRWEDEPWTDGEKKRDVSDESKHEAAAGEVTSRNQHIQAGVMTSFFRSLVSCAPSLWWRELS